MRESSNSNTLEIGGARQFFFNCLKQLKSTLNSDAGVGIGMLVGPSEGWVGGWEGFL